MQVPFMRRGAITLFVVGLLLLSASSAIGSSQPLATTTSPDPTVSRNTTLSLTPSDPGSVAVSVSYSVPPSVSMLETRLPEEAMNVRPAGFEHVANTTYRWERGDDRPIIRFRLPANRTGSAATLDASHTDIGYTFVDTGPWALVEIPRMPVQWSRTGPPVAFDESTTVDGAGVAGRRMAYLGPYETWTRTAFGQQFRLVVPEAANLNASPTAILDSLASAADRIRIGERDDSVLVIAAPQVIDWGARGLAGDTDAWVVADEPLTQAFNPWLHEYLHTRQSFRTTVATQWTTEATATYYAALLSLQQGLIDFTAFHDFLERGAEPPVDDGVLSVPRTWRGSVVYLKGALVWGAFDLALRQASAGHTAAIALLKELNDVTGPVTEADLARLAETVGGTTGAAFLGRYTTTRDAPEPWSQRIHERAFGTDPPRFQYSFSRTDITVSGPYRNISGLPQTVVVGETITVPAVVNNLGGLRGEFSTALRVDGLTVNQTAGILGAGGQQQISLKHTFRDTGMVTLELGGESLRLRVAEADPPSVSNLSVNQSTVQVGDSIALTVHLANTQAWPAGGTLPVSVDGETVTTLSPRLTGNESTTTTIRIQLNDRGTHHIDVGNRSVSVTVESVGVSAPGFGVGIAGMAIVLTILLLGIRRQ